VCSAIWLIGCEAASRGPSELADITCSYSCAVVCLRELSFLLRYDMTYFMDACIMLVGCLILCDEMVDATSSECFPVLLCLFCNVSLCILQDSESQSVPNNIVAVGNCRFWC